MSSQRGALVVIGSGPGIGRAVTQEFASHGFKRIFLLSRSAQRLEEEKEAVVKEIGTSKVQISTIPTDVSEPTSLQAALKQIDDSGDVVETVFYNAAKVAPSTLFEYSAEDIELEFKTNNIALYQVAQWFLPRVASQVKQLKRPSLLVTNSHLWIYPFPAFFSLSMVKAAQRNLVQTLNKVYAPQGVHVCTIAVSGIVDPKDETLNPANIAQKTWKFFEEGKNEDMEIEIWQPGVREMMAADYKQELTWKK